MQFGSFSAEDCRLTIASEYGFTNWLEVDALGDLQYEIEFELAVNALLDGERDLLEKMLAANPDLTIRRSATDTGLRSYTTRP
ncbi:MAG: hypothetical protein R3281_13920 [Balneolaceae bacterium]|nr:hypothetical protein [Balneolaceae bacterium]